MFNKKYFLVFALVAAGILLGVVVKACGVGDMDTVMGELFFEQKITEIEQINCNQVSLEQYLQVGEAYIGVMVPNKGQHELMDKMMGGEGSDSLKNYQVYMGKQYLGCSEGGAVMPLANMMNLTTNQSWPEQMMGFNSSGSGFGFWGIFFAVFSVLLPLGAATVLGLLSWYLIKKIKSK